MSDTKVDMEKVKKMLDDGWEVRLFKNQLGSFTAVARRGGLVVETDDFTAEQSLTRLAYKVDGVIL